MSQPMDVDNDSGSDPGSDYEDSDGHEEMDDAFKDPVIVRESSITVLDRPAIVESANCESARIAQLFGLTPELALHMLRRNRWASESLIRRWFENPDRVLLDAGLSLSPAPPPPAGVVCGICSVPCELASNTHPLSLACGHFFCKECWSWFMSDKVRNFANGCTSVLCPQYGCKLIVCGPLVREVLPPEDFERYSDFLVRAFVDENDKVKWCPAPGCGRAISAQRINRTNTKCACGFSFCFRCLGDEHQPTSCAFRQKWIEKNHDEGGTAQWAQAHDVKRCPKCHEFIEKNEGCIHMTHRKPAGCGHEFCWLCLTDWETHGGYNCNRPRQQEMSSSAKFAYERYIHYYERFRNHENSLKMAETERLKVLRKVEIRSRGDMMLRTINDYLIQAFDTVIEARQVLKWSYPFAFYCEDAQLKNLFEFQQQYLEDSTERLHEMIEKPDEDHVLRQQIVDLNNAGRRFLGNLLDTYGER